MSIAFENDWYNHGYAANATIFWNQYHKKNCLFKIKTNIMDNKTISTLFAHANVHSTKTMTTIKVRKNKTAERDQVA